MVNVTIPEGTPPEVVPVRVLGQPASGAVVSVMVTENLHEVVRLALSVTLQETYDKPRPKLEPVETLQIGIDFTPDVSEDVKE